MSDYIPSHKEVIQSVFESKKIRVSLPKQPAEFADITKFLNSPAFEEVTSDVLATIAEGLYANMKESKGDVKQDHLESMFKANLELIMRTLMKRAGSSDFFTTSTKGKK